MPQHTFRGLDFEGGGQNYCCPALEAQAAESDTEHGFSRQKHFHFVLRGHLLAVRVSDSAFGCMMMPWHCCVMQGPDVITFVSPTASQVSILNATNAVVTDEAPGIANLTAAVAIPQGTYANFSVLINATSQVCCQQVLCMTIMLFACLPVQRQSDHLQCGAVLFFPCSCRRTNLGAWEECVSPHAAKFAAADLPGGRGP